MSPIETEIKAFQGVKWHKIFHHSFKNKVFFNNVEEALHITNDENKFSMLSSISERDMHFGKY